MSESASKFCLHCNAKQLGPSENCWLCGNSLSEKNVGLPPLSALSEHKPEPERFSFSLATLFLIITLASVCLGLIVVFPGLGILACIVMVPVFFRTAKVVRYREEIGEDVPPAQKVTLFLGSFVVSSILVTVVGIAAFCSFCGVCMTVVSLSGDTEMLPLGLGVSAVAIVSIVIAVKVFRWNRRRYRRDLGEE